MASRAMATAVVNISKKFQGSLMGCLIGDCMGEPYEGMSKNGKSVNKFFESVRKGEIKPGSLHYTDDTAMLKVLATSLAENKCVDHKDLAKRLTDLYFAEPDRGYGYHVGQVFENLSVNPITTDVLKPARDQFNGSGSYGNGAAMRCAPIGLFFHNKDLNLLIEAARDSALVTHAHRDGYNGAVLQALAVRQALLMDPSDPINPLEFVRELQTQMEKIEKNDSKPFTEKLTTIESFLNYEQLPNTREVIETLGNSVTATESVPTAIFAFLMSGRQIEGIDTVNAFERAIQYAISLGGDTDTIACMAGGICGAYVGIDDIPSHLINVCEKQEEILHLSDQLLQACLE